MNITHHRGAEFSLQSLVQTASALLQAAPAPADKRVNPVPDARTVRYYQSSQLVDKPLRYQGRSAVYGYRHLLQVCAVKLLQGAGRSLQDIQRGLVARGDAELERTLLPALSPGTPLPPAPPAYRPLISAQLRPGVVITVDPSLVADPHSLLRAIAASLSQKDLQ